MFFSRGVLSGRSMCSFFSSWFFQGCNCIRAGTRTRLLSMYSGQNKLSHSQTNVCLNRREDIMGSPHNGIPILSRIFVD